MKKPFLFCTVYFVLCIGTTFAYTSDDTSNANYLADQGIVTKQTIASKYRLDDKILRQEVIGMALKVKGITLPDNYTCKKYFADATKNDWVCRAVELAADNGIITKANKNANPGKYVTRAEALAMMMKAGGYMDRLSQEQLNSLEYWRMHFDTSITWHQDIILQAMFYTIIDVKKYLVNTGYVGSEGVTGNSSTLDIKFYPDRLATRAEVFGFTKNILGKNISIKSGECESVSIGPGTFTVKSTFTILKANKEVASFEEDNCTTPKIEFFVGNKMYFSLPFDGIGGGYVYDYTMNLYEFDSTSNTVKNIFKGFGSIDIQNGIMVSTVLNGDNTIGNTIVVTDLNNNLVLGKYDFPEIKGINIDQSRQVGNFRFSPDGSKIAFSAFYIPALPENESYGEVYILDRASGKISLYAETKDVAYPRWENNKPVW